MATAPTVVSRREVITRASAEVGTGPPAAHRYRTRRACSTDPRQRALRESTDQQARAVYSDGTRRLVHPWRYLEYGQRWDTATQTDRGERWVLTQPSAYPSQAYHLAEFRWAGN